jgi:hypothetical protein
MDKTFRAYRLGQPPYHGALMVKLLLYGYCTGMLSSRKKEVRGFRRFLLRGVRKVAGSRLTTARECASPRHPDQSGASTQAPPSRGGSVLFSARGSLASLRVYVRASSGRSQFSPYPE